MLPTRHFSVLVAWFSGWIADCGSSSQAPACRSDGEKSWECRACREAPDVRLREWEVLRG